MIWLLAVSLVWAFSFGLIKGRLAGLDPEAVAAVRLAVAALVFIAWLRVRDGGRGLRWRLAGIGAVQYGVMYVLYLRAFAHLQAHEVALFTIFTPVYLTLLDAAWERRWQPRHLVAALLAVAGAGAALWRPGTGDVRVAGFLLVQGSNLCFAAGQLAYRRLRPRFPEGFRDAHAFLWLALGGLGATALAALPGTDWAAFRPTPGQVGVLLYLGVVATGLGFYLWNLGVTRVNAGTLAVFNNAKVPLGILVSLVVFGERADPLRLGVSLGLLAAAALLAEARR
jgi:drug/metabolite transporter (DMT)-like permease